MGGEAALQAGKALKANILDLAASVLQTTADALTLEDGEIRDLGPRGTDGPGRGR